jgi:hypothetical protein
MNPPLSLDEPSENAPKLHNYRARRCTFVRTRGLEGCCCILLHRSAFLGSGDQGSLNWRHEKLTVQLSYKGELKRHTLGRCASHANLPNSVSGVRCP